MDTEDYLKQTNNITVDATELYIRQKRILFLRFPLSDVTYNSDQTIINTYILDTLGIRHMIRQFNHVGILDHVSGGGTIKKLVEHGIIIFTSECT